MAIKPFEVMDVLARAKSAEAAGRRIIHLEIGEPDFPTPIGVVRAARSALRTGAMAYTQTLGLPQLREAISDHYRAVMRTGVSPARIAITTGASGALLLAMALLVNPGDEVLVPDPGYPSYRSFVGLFEGKPRALALDASGSFQPSIAAIREVWTRRTRGIIIGSPSNPTGTVIPGRELRAIAEFVAARGGWLLIDEIYQELRYGSDPATGASLPGTTVVVNSFSKYFCMTGWRIGWAVVPERLMREMEKLAQHMTICPPAIAQHAALAALEPASLRIFEGRRREFERRRDVLVQGLRHAGLHVPVLPDGAFYAYADIGRRGARELAVRMLDQAGVAATPGTDFGLHKADRHMRFAFTRPVAELAEAVQRIGTFFASPANQPDRRTR